MSRFKPNVLHGRQYTNRRHQFLKPTNCSGAGSSNSTRFFSPMVGQLRAHSLHPDYLPHSTPTPIPHSTSPTPPPKSVSIYNKHHDMPLKQWLWCKRDRGTQIVVATKRDLSNGPMSGRKPRNPVYSLYCCFGNSDPPQIPHSPPSGLRLWDITPKSSSFWL